MTAGRPLLVWGVLCVALSGCEAPPSSVTRSFHEQGVQTPHDLHPAERAFLEARLETAVELLTVSKRDSADELLLAYAMLLEGDEQGATRIFRNAMASPSYEREHLFFGLSSLITGQLKQAAEHFDTERGQAPEQFFATILHIETLTMDGRFDEASAEIAELIKRYPQENIVHHTRGHLESARKSWKAALVAYDRARTLGGSNPDLYESIASALIGLHDLAGAEEEIRRCKEEFPAYTEILFQEIRLVALQPTLPTDRLVSLTGEYRNRSRRPDRLAELGQILERD